MVTSPDSWRSYRGIRESYITSAQRHLESLKHQAKQLRRAPVRVVSPVPGGAEWLRFELAARHVESGRARWVHLTGGERRIEFIGRQQDAVLASAVANRAVHSTIATLAQVARLPMVRPGDVVAPSPRRHFGTIKSVFSDMRHSPQRLRK